MKMSVTRRQFVQAAGAGIAVTAACGNAWTATADPVRTIEHGDALGEFQYREVEFRPGLHQSQLEQTHGILMGLDEDSLLRPFRYWGGMPAPGFELPGWYGSDGGNKGHGPHVPGHAFGQWISALSRYYAITGDQKTRDKIFRLLRGYGETVEPSGKLYAKGYTEPNQPSDAGYTYGMLVGGLADAHELAHYPSALDVLNRVTDAAVPYLPDKVNEHDDAFMMPHNLFVAWQRGAPSDHLELAKKYLLHEFFDPLARGENVLGGRHAYSHLDALNSAVKAYLVLGDAKYLKAAVNGFEFIERQSFVTGASGPGEHFLPRAGEDYLDPATGEKRHYPAIETPADSILNEHWHFETGCGSYAHFKLTRYLLRITKNSHYGDSMERVMYNAALGMLPLNEFGKAFYQSNYHRYARKEYFDGYDHGMSDEWPCCSGTLTQLAADYRIGTYFGDAKGIFGDLYLPSTWRWSHVGADVSLSQGGSYPLSDRVTFTVATSRPIAFDLRFRIPAWTETPALHVDGVPVADIKPGSFAEIQRKWRGGEKIELVLPRPLKLKPADERHADLVALCSGPLVLFAIGEDLPKLHRETLLAARQTASASTEWRSGDVRFLPWWALKDEIYTTYHDVSKA